MNTDDREAVGSLTVDADAALPDDGAAPAHLALVVRRVVVTCCLLLAAASATAATLFPTFRAPDEPAHIDLVRHVSGTWTQPDVGERMLSRQVVDSYPLVGFRSGTPGEAPALGASIAPDRSDRPSFDAVGPDEPSTLRNQMPQHPPGYYWLAAVWRQPLRLLGNVAFDVEVLWLRTLGVLLVAPLPWLSAQVARTLGAGRRAQAGAAVATLAVPMLVHIAGSVNNDTLLIPLGGALTVAAVAIARGGLGPRRALLAGILLGLALLTKAFAFALVLTIGAAYAVALVRDPAAWRRAVGSAAVAGAVALAIGGWWWIRNIAVYGTLQPGGGTDPVPPDRFVADPAAWLPLFAGRMVRRWWIEPDIVDRQTPLVLVVATALLVVAVAVALWRPAGPRRADLAVALVPVTATLALVLFAAWRVYARTGVPFAIHGRYLFPGLAGLAAVVAVGVVRPRDRGPRLGTGAAVGALAAAAVALQLLAAFWTLTTYWGTGTRGTPLAALRAWVAWSPVPASVTVATALLTAVVAVALAVHLARLARIGEAGPQRAPGAG